MKLSYHGKTVARNASLYTNPLKQAWGMMFRLPQALVFDFKREKQISLHNMFVFFALDLIFLNEEQRIVEIKQSFRPFTFYFPFEKARYVIEVPHGVVKKHGMEKGHRVRFGR